MSETKPIWASRLFWTGVVQTALGLYQMCYELAQHPDHPPSADAVLFLILGVVTIILRIRTNQLVEPW